MADSISSHQQRKVGGVRFTTDADDLLTKHDENPSNNRELQWEKYCDEQSSFDLYFGILKLAHIYTTTFDVVFPSTPIRLEAVLDQQQPGGLELSVTESPSSPSNNQISFQVEIVINPEAISGSFCRTLLLRELSTSVPQRTVRVIVRGKILRDGQGTATLKDGIHMKSMLTKANDDE